MKTNKDELSRTVDILLPRGVDDYEYEVTWFVRGQQPKSSARQYSNYAGIYIDSF
jgi:hypothetical protein